MATRWPPSTCPGATEAKLKAFIGKVKTAPKFEFDGPGLTAGVTWPPIDWAPKFAKITGLKATAFKIEITAELTVSVEWEWIAEKIGWQAIKSRGGQMIAQLAEMSALEATAFAAEVILVLAAIVMAVEAVIEGYAAITAFLERFELETYVDQLQKKMIDGYFTGMRGQWCGYDDSGLSHPAAKRIGMSAKRILICGAV